MRNQRLADAETPCRLVEADPVRRRGTSGETTADLVGEKDTPRRARGELLSREEAVAQPAMYGVHADVELARGLVGGERPLAFVARRGCRADRDLVLASQ